MVYGLTQTERRIEVSQSLLRFLEVILQQLVRDLKRYTKKKIKKLFGLGSL